MYTRYKRLKCKLKGHKEDGHYQGYWPEIGCDKICAACGTTLKKCSEKKLRTDLKNTFKYLVDKNNKLKKVKYSKKDIEEYIKNWKS